MIHSRKISGWWGGKFLFRPRSLPIHLQEVYKDYASFMLAVSTDYGSGRSAYSSALVAITYGNKGVPQSTGEPQNVTRHTRFSDTENLSPFFRFSKMFKIQYLDKLNNITDWGGGDGVTEIFINDKLAKNGNIQTAQTAPESGSTAFGLEPRNTKRIYFRRLSIIFNRWWNSQGENYQMPQTNNHKWNGIVGCSSRPIFWL